MAISDYLTTGQQAPTAIPTANRDNNQLVADSLESFLGGNSSYINNARQRGVEYAATRGGINSSIAAGASERAAIEAAQPLAAQALDFQKGTDQANLNNWLEQQNFSRSLVGQSFSNASSMLQQLQAASIEDPELFTPEVVSGYTNFFNNNMNQILSQYFNQGINNGSSTA